MSCQFCGGLRLCVRHHPPLVTFWLCLLMLAATFLFYAFYIRAFPVNDADYTKDFDTVLQTLSASKLCPRWNATAAVPSLQSSEDVANASVLASVTLPSSVNHSALQIRATARQLGMTGLDTDSHLLLTVTCSWRSAQCNLSDAECSGKCCVIVTGPRSLLPHSWSSLQCYAANPSRQQPPEELYVMEGESDSPPQCYSLHYRGDPGLKAMMSQEDCAVSSGHLLAAMLVCLLVALLLFVVSACWVVPIKDKRTPAAL